MYPLPQSQILTTLIQTSFGNSVGKEENSGNQSFIIFPTRFSTLLRFGFINYASSNLSSETALNLDLGKTFWLGKELTLGMCRKRLKGSKHSSHIALTLSETTNSRLFQTERVCRRQFQI